MAIYREETFGPIAAVTVFDNETQAIAMANDTDYGLAPHCDQVRECRNIAQLEQFIDELG